MYIDFLRISDSVRHYKMEDWNDLSESQRVLLGNKYSRIASLKNLEVNEITSRVMFFAKSNNLPSMPLYEGGGESGLYFSHGFMGYKFYSRFEDLEKEYRVLLSIRDSNSSNIRHIPEILGRNDDYYFLKFFHFRDIETLKSRLRKGCFSSEEILFVAIMCIEGIIEMRRAFIAHCDIQLNNILVLKCGIIKGVYIIDFESASQDINFIKKGKNRITGPENDLVALGHTLYCCFCGDYIWDKMYDGGSSGDRETILDEIRREREEAYFHGGKGISEKYLRKLDRTVRDRVTRYILRSLIDRDGSKQPDLAECIATLEDIRMYVRNK